MPFPLRTLRALGLGLGLVGLGSSPALALVAADLCTGNPCVITGNFSTTDVFTTLDFGTADVTLQGTLNFGPNNVDISAGSFAIAATGKIVAQSTTSADDGGSVSIVTTGDIQLDSNNTGGSIVANGCSGGSVSLQSVTGSITGTRGINANRNTACLVSGDGGFVELIAAQIDLSGELNTIGGIGALGGTVDVDGASLVRLGPVNVSGGEGDAGILLVSSGGPVTLSTITANSIGNIGVGGSVSVVSGGLLEALGTIDALGGLGSSDGDSGGDVTLQSGTIGQEHDVHVVGRIRANGRGLVGAGGSIDISGATVSVDAQLIANGAPSSAQAGSIDVFGTQSVTLSAALSTTQGGNGLISVISDGSLDVSAAVDAGASSGMDGGDVTLIGTGPVNVAANVLAQGNGVGTLGGSIFLDGCTLSVGSAIQVDASGETGTVELVSGQQMTASGVFTAGPTFGTMLLRYRRASKPPVTSGASFNISPTIMLDPTIPPCAVCAVTGDSDLDGVDDSCDSCILVPNASQLDTDGDGFGNACDCDFDQTGTCAISDFNTFLTDFATSLDGGSGTDMDGDGVVGIGDFNLFLPGFQATTPGPSAMSP